MPLVDDFDKTERVVFLTVPLVVVTVVKHELAILDHDVDEA
jgi:hypothetical protein